MFAVMAAGRLALYRRGVGGRAERWHTVEGDAAALRLALETAQSLAAEHAGLTSGGGAEPFGLRVDLPEPCEAGQILPGLFPKDPANGGLGQLQVTGGGDRPGPVRVGVLPRPPRLAVVPPGNVPNR